MGNQIKCVHIDRLHHLKCATPLQWECPLPAAAAADRDPGTGSKVDGGRPVSDRRESRRQRRYGRVLIRNYHYIFFFSFFLTFIFRPLQLDYRWRPNDNLGINDDWNVAGGERRDVCRGRSLSLSLSLSLTLFFSFLFRLFPIFIIFFFSSFFLYSSPPPLWFISSYKNRRKSVGQWPSAITEILFFV